MVNATEMVRPFGKDLLNGKDFPQVLNL